MSETDLDLIKRLGWSSGGSRMRRGDLVATPFLKEVLREQDMRLLRDLMIYKPEGPLDEKSRDDLIETILKRLGDSK